MERLKDKVAIVTGAGTGIGRATAIAFANEGAKVVLTDIREDGGRAVEAALRDEGFKATFIPQDVAKEEDWHRVFKQVGSRFGRLDILVNNAGVLRLGTVQDSTMQDWQRLRQVNMDSVFLGIKMAVPMMAETGGGSIVNVASSHAIKGTPLESLYGATKAAVRIFARSIALECARAGNNIRVNSVLPGPIDTSVLDHLPDAVRAQLGNMESLKQKVVETVPLGRLGKPEEVAKGIVYLASEESSFVTGTDLIIDGGMTA